jgi:hypothetical protein
MARNRGNKDTTDDEGKKDNEGKKDGAEATTSDGGATTSDGVAMTRKGDSKANKLKGKGKRAEVEESDMDKVDVNTSTFGEESE